MDFFSWDFLTALGAIVVLDLVLAGDNAVVIAMASHHLPTTVRRRAVLLGTAGAVLIRMLMTLVAVWLLTVPYLQALGGVILLPIALKLLKPQTQELSLNASASFWAAVRTIIIADAAMGIDNVLAIAGAAHGNFILVLLGLMISVPIIVGGSQLIGRLMEQYPVLIYIGSAIMAWTAGSMVMHDRIVGVWLTATGPLISYGLPALCVLAVCGIGFRMRAR